MTSKQDDRIDGRPFYLEEVTIEEPSTGIKYDKVIVEPINKNPLNKLSDGLNKLAWFFKKSSKISENMRVFRNCKKNCFLKQNM